MSSSTTPHIDSSENFVGFSLPAFDVNNARVWFLQLEALFRCRRITSQTSMFSYVAAHLPTHIAADVVDLLDPVPTDSPYDKLKAAVLKRLTASDESRLHQLLSGVELGDRSPSQLLRYMRSLVGSSKVDDSVLRQLWLKCLPSNTTAILAVSADDLSLDKLAETADKVHECFFQRPICHAVVNPPETSSSSDPIESICQRLSILELAVKRGRRPRSRSFRSTSRSRNRHARNTGQHICYYHRRFGDAAKNCRPGCSHPKAFPKAQQGNAPASQ
ncbi:unnamed protein product [Dicrocoelium dendriticum]|nr:unnamed protein product [Dicrocoelium dendriticum]